MASDEALRTIFRATADDPGPFPIASGLPAGDRPLSVEEKRLRRDVCLGTARTLLQGA
jgi:hypothetical protein